MMTKMMMMMMTLTIILVHQHSMASVKGDCAVLGCAIKSTHTVWKRDVHQKKRLQNLEIILYCPFLFSHLHWPILLGWENFLGNKLPNIPAVEKPYCYSTQPPLLPSFPI